MEMTRESLGDYHAKVMADWNERVMSDAPSLRSNETLISATRDSLGRVVVIAHVAPGIEPAGSGARPVKECWRVIREISGVRHSREFNSLAKAMVEGSAQ